MFIFDLSLGVEEGIEGAVGIGAEGGGVEGGEDFEGGVGVLFHDGFGTVEGFDGFRGGLVAAHEE